MEPTTDDAHVAFSVQGDSLGTDTGEWHNLELVELGGGGGGCQVLIDGMPVMGSTRPETTEVAGPPWHPPTRQELIQESLAALPWYPLLLVLAAVVAVIVLQRSSEELDSVHHIG